MIPRPYIPPLSIGGSKGEASSPSLSPASPRSILASLSPRRLAQSLQSRLTGTTGPALSPVQPDRPDTVLGRLCKSSLLMLQERHAMLKRLSAELEGPQPPASPRPSTLEEQIKHEASRLLEEAEWSFARLTEYCRDHCDPVTQEPSTAGEQLLVQYKLDAHELSAFGQAHLGKVCPLLSPRRTGLPPLQQDKG